MYFKSFQIPSQSSHLKWVEMKCLLQTKGREITEQASTLVSIKKTCHIYVLSCGTLLTLQGSVLIFLMIFLNMNIYPAHDHDSTLRKQKRPKKLSQKSCNPFKMAADSKDLQILYSTAVCQIKPSSFHSQTTFLCQSDEL